jgi:hypothetical protein
MTAYGLLHKPVYKDIKPATGQMHKPVSEDSKPASGHMQDPVPKDSLDNPYLDHLDPSIASSEDHRVSSFHYTWFFDYKRREMRRENLEQILSEHRFFTLTRCVLCLSQQACLFV